jgi:hypothetical protein
MAVLDIHINDGFVPMVDGSLVYHRGFGDRRTAVNDPKPALAMGPRVITANGRVVVSRTYPLGAPVPPHGRPAPLRPDPAFARQFLARRGLLGQLLSAADADCRDGQHHRDHGAQQPGAAARDAVPPCRAGRGRRRLRSGGAGKSKLLRFRAPLPGTYVYTDPGNQPVERTLGLYGAWW